MKKYFMCSVLCLSMMAGTALFSSCSDDDVENKPAPGSPEYITQSKATEKARTLYQLLGTLAPTDSLPDNWETATYEPMIGDALDGANPYVRTLAVSGMDEAVSIYNAMTGRELKADAQSDTWSYEGLGSLSFQAAGTAELTATIQCALSQMPHLTSLRLVPASALGENADFKPYYHLGDIIQDLSDNSYWICARPANAAAGKKDSHWFSFQLSEKENYKTYKETTKRKTTIVPNNLGSNEEKMEYLMELLTLMTSPENYADMIQAGMFDKGLGDLGNAYNYADIRQMASQWEKNVWNRTTDKIIPVGKNYFKDNTEIIFLYYGHTSPLFSSTVKLYQAVFDGTWHRNSRLVTYPWDMDKGYAFDIHHYVNTGEKGAANEVGPDKALVVRYKTGSQIAKNKMLRISPEVEIPNTKSICRLDRNRPMSDTSYKPGDVLYNKDTGVAYFCLYPAWPDKGISQAFFVSCSEKALTPSADRKSITNAISEADAPRVIYMLKYLRDHYLDTNMHIDMYMYMTSIASVRLWEDDDMTYDCTSLAYMSEADGRMYLLRCVSYDNRTYFYKRYIPTSETDTPPLIQLVDVTNQDIIDKYSLDRWSRGDFVDVLRKRCMNQAVPSYDISDYIKSMSEELMDRKYNIFNEYVCLLSGIFLKDGERLPAGYNLVENKRWSGANDIHAIQTRWLKECNDPDYVRMDDAAYTGK